MIRGNMGHTRKNDFPMDENTKHTETIFYNS